MTLYIGFAAVSLMIALSPGPSWIYVISSTLSRGRKGGLAAAAGNSAGILCHAMFAAAGLSAVVAYSAAAFNIVRMIGAGYLVYLGCKILIQGGITGKVKRNGSQKSASAIFGGGMLVNLLNPKMALLMLSLLPQFISADAAHPWAQITLLGSMHALIAGLVHLNVALFSGTIAMRVNRTSIFQKLVRSVAGVLFLFFGFRMALS